MTVIRNVVNVLEMKHVTVFQAFVQKAVLGIGRNQNVMVRSRKMTCSKATKYVIFRSRAIGETLNKYGYNVDTSFKINQFVIGNYYSVNLYFRRHFANSVNFNLAFTSECLKFVQRKVTFGLSPLSRKDSSVKTSRNTFKIHDENKKKNRFHTYMSICFSWKKYLGRYENMFIIDEQCSAWV